MYVSLEKLYPLVQEISYIQDYTLENGVKVTQNLTYLNYVTPIYPLKSDEYPPICSKKYLIFSKKSNFCQLATDLENEVQATKYSKFSRLSLRYSSASLVGIKTKMQEIYHF